MHASHATTLPVPVSIRTEPQIATRSQRLIGGISPGRIGLFTLMLASEAPVIAVRALLIEAAAAITSILFGISLPHPPAPRRLTSRPDRAAPSARRSTA